MSILLSAYYPEGIVFAADKNVTFSDENGTGQHVESCGTKVLIWPNRKAIVGFVGAYKLVSLPRLSSKPMDEWMRYFIEQTKDFDDIADVAEKLRSKIQKDFNATFSPSKDISKESLIVHLGGFRKVDEIHVPVLFHIWNHLGIDKNQGYREAVRDFNLSEDFEKQIKIWSKPSEYSDYPTRVQERLQAMVDDNRFMWFNNGYDLGIFNLFKAHIWHVLGPAVWSARDKGLLPADQTMLDLRIAYCKMAVTVYGSFFEYHVAPESRVVGGGVDAEYIPWPD